MKTSRTPCKTTVGSPVRPFTPRKVSSTTKKPKPFSNATIYKKACKSHRSPLNSEILASLNKNEIQLRSNSLDDLDIEVLCSVFPYLKNIQQIILFNKTTQSISTRTPTPTTSSRYRTLYDKYPLTARYNELSASQVEKLMGKLVSALSRNLGFLSLGNIELNSIRLHGEVWKGLGKGLESVYNLRSVSLVECAISDEILSYFIKGMQHQRELVYLNLMGNFLSDQCGFYLSRVLSRHEEKRDEMVWAYGLRGGKLDSKILDNGIEELILKNNSLCDKAVYSICGALYQNTQLRHLDLSDNKLTAYAYQDIISMLHTNTALLSIDITNNTEQPSFMVMKTIVTRLRNNLKHCYETRPYIADKWQYRLIELQKAIEPSLFSMEATPDQSSEPEAHCRNCKEYHSVIQTYEIAIIDYEHQLQKLQGENTRLKKTLKSLGFSENVSDLSSLKNIEHAIVYLSKLLEKVGSPG